MHPILSLINGWKNLPFLFETISEHENVSLFTNDQHSNFSQSKATVVGLLVGNGLQEYFLYISMFEWKRKKVQIISFEPTVCPLPLNRKKVQSFTIAARQSGNSMIRPGYMV